MDAKVVDAKAHELTRGTQSESVLTLGPLLLQCQQERLWAKLENPKTGERYRSFQDWHTSRLGLSHAFVINTINLYRYVVPAIIEAGLDPVSELKLVNRSKLHLLAPLYVVHVKCAYNVPRRPDIHELLRICREKSWREVSDAVRFYLDELSLENFNATRHTRVIPKGTLRQKKRKR